MKTIPNAKTCLYHLLLCRDKDMTNNEIEIAVLLAKDKDVQKIIEDNSK